MLLPLVGVTDTFEAQASEAVDAIDGRNLPDRPLRCHLLGLRGLQALIQVLEPRACQRMIVQP